MNDPQTTPDTPTAPEGSTGECQCREARKWRAYWTRDAIADRLEAELNLYRNIRLERINEACNDMRGPRRLGHYEDGTPYVSTLHLPTFEELERRRQER